MKRTGQLPIKALAAGHNHGLFSTWYETSRRQFLVDAGAEVSVLPATGLDTCRAKPGPPLTGANGSTIKAYGSCTITLRLASQNFMWKFIVADVSRPLLGADFLWAKALLVDLKSEHLVDARTYHSVCLGKDRALAPSLNAIATSVNEFVRLLSEFPDITVPNFTQPPIKHGVEHFTSTKGPPISARACRLPPDN